MLVLSARSHHGCEACWIGQILHHGAPYLENNNTTALGVNVPVQLENRVLDLRISLLSGALNPFESLDSFEHAGVRQLHHNSCSDGPAILQTWKETLDLHRSRACNILHRQPPEHLQVY